MAGSGDTESTTTSIGEDVDLLYRMDDEDPTKRYDAATWLRKRVGVVAAKDLPAEPSEEDFRQGLRSGMILCNVLNKIQSGAVPKVVDAPSAVFYTPDAAAQSAYFENIRNFLMAIEEMGLPTFEPSDLEQGGDFSRVVNSVLALKAYSETGSRRFSWTSKSSQSGKQFVRRNSEPSINVISRTQSVSSEKSFDTTDQFGDGYELNEECDSGPLYMIVCDLLEDKEEEDIPLIVENILNKVKEEFESRLGVHMPKDENGLSTIEPPRSCPEDIKPIFKDVNNKREDTTQKTEKEEFETRDDDQDDREKESLSLKENASKQEEEEKASKQEEEEKAAEEQERIKRDNELQALKEKARKQEEDDKAAKEQERINREKELLAQKEQARKQEEERIKKEKELLAQKEKIRKQEEERIKKEKQLLAQKEKMRKQEEARARKERERIKRQKELLALKEKAKQEMSAKELERINRERELLELEEKERQEEEEQERIEREQELLAKKERALKKEEYKRRMDEYNKLSVNTTRREELLDQQDKELQVLRSTLSTAKTDVRSMQKSCQEEADNLGKHVQNLCQAAAGYKKVLEENRKLYNQVQDLKGSIRVYCRVRPFLAGQENHVTSVDYMDDETVTIIIPSKSGKEGRKASMFNKVFGPSATQEEVFSDTQPLIRSVLDGFNVCIFACGQTGAGKTYTLTGPEDLTPETMGVGYRALNDLFLISEERKNLMNYEISINMLDVYNDEIRDLLVTDGTSKILDICNGAKKGINVPDANLVPVSSTDEVINLMNLCQKNRAVNDHSSRSHSFLTVHVFGKDLTAGTTIRGCMHLVDLAGSEKLDSSDDEATHIQKSLSALGDVLVALANKSKNVPYKSCKLTQLLQDALGAQAKILMFVHVHPDIDEALETLNTFKFVERFSTLEGGAGKSSEVRDLKEQICYLKAALAKKESGDPQWQDFSLNSPRSGKESGFGDILNKQNDASEEESIDESAPSKLKNPNLKPPTKSPSLKKLTAGAVAAAKLGKQQTTLDSKKKKGK